MKNFLLIFILIVSMVGTYAQDSKKWYNGIGIRAGVNTSTMAYGRTFNNFTTGFTAGAKYRLPIVSGLGVDFGLYYASKGGLDYHASFNKPFALKLSYLQLPVMVNYEFRMTDFSISPSIGLYYGYCLGAVVSAAGEPSSSWIDDPRNRQLERSDFGIRLNFDFAWRRLVLSVGGDFGLVNVATKYRQITPDIHVKTNNRWQPSSFYLTLGWNF